MAGLGSGLKKTLYHILPMSEASRANRIIDKEINKRIDKKTANDQCDYSDLPMWVLRIRMKQEHERDRLIEAKTDRLGQRILGMIAFGGIFLALSPAKTWSPFEIVPGSVFLIYVVRAWWLTVKANETTTVYGFGTNFEFEANRDKSVLARGLYCQEMTNLKKHNVNVASVRCLRNALVIGVFGVLVHFVILLW